VGQVFTVSGGGVGAPDGTTNSARNTSSISKGTMIHGQRNKRMGSSFGVCLKMPVLKAKYLPAKGDLQNVLGVCYALSGTYAVPDFIKVPVSL
jgi:hypothetical protein